MVDSRFLDEVRRRIQQVLSQPDTVSSSSEPETEEEWLNYFEEFDWQLENAPTITVRERIGNPLLRPINQIPADELDDAVNDLLDFLVGHGIVVDLLGDWDAVAAYRYITEELLDEEMSDIRIEDMFTHFDASTPEYDAQMWVEIFVGEVFWKEHENFLTGLEKQPLFDMAGEPMTAAEFTQQLKAVWARIPVTKHVDVSPITVQVAGDEGTVTAVVAWPESGQQKQVESFFRLQPSPYSGWDVVQTSLLDDLLALDG